MSLRCVVAFPKGQGLEVVDEFRLQFDPLAREIPAHLTIVFPFESQLSHEELLAHVQRMTRGVKPIRLLLQGITQEEEGYLFLNVAGGGDQVIELHDRLYSGPLEQYRSTRQRYLPHMTIGRHSDPLQLQRAFEAADKIRGSFSTKIDSLSIMRIESPEPDVAEAIIPLEG